MKLLKEMHKKESGQALILVVILLLLGSVIIASLLGFMSTGLLAGQVFEERMDKVYAADAGVELALWQLKIGGLAVDEVTPEILTPSPMNDKTVNTVVVTIENQGNAVYKITSVATSDDGATTVESYVSALDFSFFFENGITSGGSVTFQPGSSTNGTVVEDYDGDWPTADQFSEYYLPNVDTSAPFASSILDIKDYPVILPSGSLYRAGDLDILNSGAAGNSATLNGTVYVTGNLDFGKTNQNFTLDLNNQTIFVEGGIDIGGKCTITGSGVIIAVGDIFFNPNIDSNPDNFVFVMSIEGTTQFNPGSEFYGSVAGNVEVQLQPGVTLNWTELTTEEEDALNFPTGDMEALEIRTWEIDLQ